MKDITKMSAAELKAELKKKVAAEKAATNGKRKEYDTLRDTYIDTVFGKVEELSGKLREFKTESIALGLELHTKMYEAYDREKPERIDNYTLRSADGTRRVMIERSWVCQYDETSTMAIASIKEVLRDKFEGRNKAMYKIIDTILMKNGDGEYDERLMARLRQHESAIDDPRFSEALDLLSKAYKPTHSRTYLRAYRKDPVTNKWVDLPMNWSGM